MAHQPASKAVTEHTNRTFYCRDVDKPCAMSALQRAAKFCKHVDRQQKNWAQANIPSISFTSWGNQEVQEGLRSYIRNGTGAISENGSTIALSLLERKKAKDSLLCSRTLTHPVSSQQHLPSSASNSLVPNHSQLQFSFYVKKKYRHIFSYLLKDPLCCMLQ